jgi:hypothetical protein
MKEKTRPSLPSSTTTLYTTSLTPLSYTTASISIHFLYLAYSVLSRWSACARLQPFTCHWLSFPLKALWTQSLLHITSSSPGGSWQWNLWQTVPNCPHLMSAITLFYQQCSATRCGFCVLLYLLSFCCVVQTKPSLITRELLDHVAETRRNCVPVWPLHSVLVLQWQPGYCLDGPRISFQLGKVFCAIQTVLKVYLASSTMDTGSFLG